MSRWTAIAVCRVVCAQALEQFQREARAMSMSLDSAVSQLSERFRQTAQQQQPEFPADVLRHQRHLRESVINGTENVIRQGRSCPQSGGPKIPVIDWHTFLWQFVWSIQGPLQSL